LAAGLCPPGHTGEAYVPPRPSSHNGGLLLREGGKKAYLQGEGGKEGLLRGFRREGRKGERGQIGYKWYNFNFNSTFNFNRTSTLHQPHTAVDNQIKGQVHFV